MQFKTTELVELFNGCGEHEIGSLKNAKIIEEKYIEARRWESVRRVVFELDGKLYMTHIRRPLTESQETESCGYYGDEQECPEVEPYEYVATDYRVVV
jgi:hypothetical protein